MTQGNRAHGYDEAFRNELMQMEDIVGMQEALEEKGIELTLDEIRQAKDRAIKAQNGESPQEQAEPMAEGELSEDELMDVAGGFTWEEIWDLVTAW